MPQGWCPMHMHPYTCMCTVHACAQCMHVHSAFMCTVHACACAHRSEVEVVREGRAHVCVGHVALELRQVLVEPLQQQLLPCLQGHVQPRCMRCTCSRHAVGMQQACSADAVHMQYSARAVQCTRSGHAAAPFARLLDGRVLGAAVLDLAAGPSVEPVGAHRRQHNHGRLFHDGAQARE